MVSFPQEKTYSLRATVIDVSNDNSNGNLVILYVPTDANLSLTDADSYDPTSIDKDATDEKFGTLKKKIAHMAKSQISFINGDASGTAHTFSGLIYAPFGKVTFEAPGKANDTAKGFSQASSGLINFNGSIVADRVELRGNTRGSFSYNAAYADIMPATYDKRKPNISTRLLKDA